MHRKTKLIASFFIILTMLMMLGGKSNQEANFLIKSTNYESTKSEESISDKYVQEKVEVKEQVIKNNINEDDLYWLSRIVMQEMGGNWVSDELQQMVASIVINRVNSNYFPNTIQEVIFQKGQYARADKLSKIEPTEKVIENCRYVLENGSILPSNVLFQAEFKQGDGVYYTYYDKYIGSTTYFCYKN